jgi:uncharacterized short protein YbdD (DUF466 family)
MKVKLSLSKKLLGLPWDAYVKWMKVHKPDLDPEDYRKKPVEKPVKTPAEEKSQ